MGIGVSIFLLAAGAILTFAVDVSASSVINVHTVGIIIMAAGGLGLLTSLIIFTPRRPRQPAQPIVTPPSPPTSRTTPEEFSRRD